jgi:signal peptidase II
MKPAWRARMIFAALAVFVVAADQLSKHAMRAVLMSHPGNTITVIPGYFDFIISHNTGGAFSIFSGASGLFLVVPILLVAVILVFVFRSGVDSITAAALAFMLGGAVGNLIDRVGVGRVFDYIDWHIHNTHWPTFNVADIFIVAGTILFAWTLMRGGMWDKPEEGEKKGGKAKKAKG